MKYKANYRLILTVTTIIVSFLLLESKRTENKRQGNKTTKNVSREDINVTVSNTDYIFFESLSKYLFISLQK